MLKKQIILAYCILTILITAVYFPIYKYEYINFDDIRYVRDNPYVNTGLNYRGLAWAFGDSISYWHPVTWLSHMLDCELFGINPGPQHLINLAFHLANTILLFTILKKMTSALWLSAFAAAIFSFHPLRVESVAWIVERKDVLSGFFCLLMIFLYLRFLKNRKVVTYLCSLLIFALALMSKPTVVMLPFILILLDYWPLKRFEISENKNNTFEFIKRSFIEKVPFFIFSLISIVVSSSSTYRLTNIISTETVPMNLRIENALVSYIKYIGMIFWPSNLSPFYPYPHSIPLSQTIGAVLLLSFIIFFIFRTAKKMPYLFIGVLWFLGTLIPSLGLVQAGTWPELADRFTYLPSIGLSIAVAWSVLYLLQRHRKFLLSLCVAVVLILAISTRNYLSYWQDSTKLFERALKINNNNYLAHGSLGYVLDKKGFHDEAIKHYMQALSIAENPVNRVNLGMALAAKGNLTEAENLFKRTVQIYPRFAPAYRCLGKLYSQENKFDYASENFKKSLEFEPFDYETHNLLGQIFEHMNNYKEAQKEFNLAVQWNPNSALAQINLGRIMVEQNQFNKANEHLVKAIQLDPNSYTAHFYLARCLSEKKEYSKAVFHLRKTLELKPDWPEAMNSLAWFLATYKNSDFFNPKKAVVLAQKACMINNYQSAGFLDTLSVSYASDNNFKKAIETTEEALEIAEKSSQKELIEELHHRLELFKNSKAYFEN